MRLLMIAIAVVLGFAGLAGVGFLSLLVPEPMHSAVASIGVIAFLGLLMFVMNVLERWIEAMGNQREEPPGFDVIQPAPPRERND